MTAKYLIWFLSMACIALAVGLGIRIYNSRYGGAPRQPVVENLEASSLTPREYLFDPPPMGGVPMSVKIWNRDVMDFADDAMGGKRLVEMIEREVSSWRPESVTSKLNNAGENEPVALSEHVFRILNASFEMHGKTEGVFNPACAPLIALWKEAARVDKVPDDAAVQARKQRSSLDLFQLDEEHKLCTRSAGGAKLDFGGIAKGYIIDATISFLQQRFVKEAVVTAGGDLRVIGTVSRTVGIRHPLKERGELYGYFYLHNSAAATSGNYERSYKIEGRNYGHIIDPRTGYPVKGPLSVTVIAPTCVDADGFATAIYILGAEEGRALADKYEGIEALILVEESGGSIRQVRTKGFPEILSL